MSDAAIISFKNSPEKNGFYVHWIGAREYVDAFVKCARAAGLPDNNEGHRMLRDIVQNYAGDSDVNFGPASALPISDGENGVYVVDNWRIVAHHDRYFSADQLARHDSGYCFGERGKIRRRVFVACLNDPIAQLSRAKVRERRLRLSIPEALAKPRRGTGRI